MELVREGNVIRSQVVDARVERTALTLARSELSPNDVMAGEAVCHQSATVRDAVNVLIRDSDDPC